MCIRDRYQRRVRGHQSCDMRDHRACLVPALLFASVTADCDGCVTNGGLTIPTPGSCWAYSGSCGAYQMKSSCWINGWNGGHDEMCVASDERNCCDVNVGLVRRRWLPTGG
eukprot:TRINITY_DN1910_c0_g1_i4.p3 TRINITY_DN1910_c0_g1~~TRINITY_DN1910_c0_g1_i4.p3  ORF type:complete len:111 (+),score=11.24 TRINITY_DN1910_c0_g1_i4:166-498(+)